MTIADETPPQSALLTTLGGTYYTSEAVFADIALAKD